MSLAILIAAACAAQDVPSPIPPVDDRLAQLPPPVDGSQSLEEQVAELRARLDAQLLPFREFDSSLGTVSDLNRTLSRVGYVYDDGFVIEGRPAADGPLYRMRLNSWLHLRHTYFDSDGPNSRENDMEFERLRFIMSGRVLSRSLTYFAQVDADNDRAQALSLLDYFLSFDVGQELFDLPADSFGIRAGQWKLPFSRSRRTSGQRLQFTDRAMSTLFFDIDRSVGVGLYGETDVLARPLTWEFALFNGFRTTGVRSGRAGELDRNLATSGRLFADLFGDWGEDSEPNYVQQDCPALRVGAGYALGRVESEGMTEFSRFRSIDTGATVSSLLPAGATGFLASVYTVDAHFKYRGASLIADYYWRTISDIGPVAVDDLFDHGFLLQAGYFVIPQKLELLSRW
jgi:hypothetical protein